MINSYDEKIMTEIDYSKFDDFEVEEMADVLYKEHGIDYSYTTWKEARIMIIEDYIDLYSCEAEQEKNTNKN